jgi:magnesium transporter
MVGAVGRDSPMLKILALHGAGGEREAYEYVDDPNRISDLLQQEGTVVWADVTNPAPGDLQLLQREFSLHPLAVEDATEHGERPKVEHFDTHTLIIAYAASRDRGDLVEVDLFVGPSWLITVHSPAGADFDVADAQDRVCRAHKERPSAPFVAYVVLDEIVDSYFPLADALGEEVDDLEGRIFATSDPERAEAEVQRALLDVRKRLLAFRRRAAPLRDVLMVLLRDEVPWISDEIRPYLQDILDHVMRVTEEIDIRRELLGNAMDAHLALASNHMNQTMKRMTSWGAILIVATLIAGIYGMNFDEMPELHWPYGYPAALGAMLTVTAMLHAYFKRRGWL